MKTKINTNIESLIEKGGNEWINYGYHRVYFSCHAVKSALGYKDGDTMPIDVLIATSEKNVKNGYLKNTFYDVENCKLSSSLKKDNHRKLAEALSN